MSSSSFHHGVSLDKDLNPLAIFLVLYVDNFALGPAFDGLDQLVKVHVVDVRCKLGPDFHRSVDHAQRQIDVDLTLAGSFIGDADPEPTGFVSRRC